MRLSDDSVCPDRVLMDERALRVYGRVLGNGDQKKGSLLESIKRVWPVRRKSNQGPEAPQQPSLHERGSR